jgi:transcriptional regulator EpsA
MIKKLFDDLRKSAEVIETHLDLLCWLEGPFQNLIEHQILIMAWGDFHNKRINFDISSRIDGVRTSKLNIANLHTKVMNLFEQWHERNDSPFSMETEAGIFQDCFDQKLTDLKVLEGYKNILVHGIHDYRGNEDCLYIFLRCGPTKNINQLDSVKKIVMFLDSAARRIHYAKKIVKDTSMGKDRRVLRSNLLSERENEVMQWVIKGKSNQDISIILNISAYTVKNHIYRIYKKLNVSNRAQAASSICI